MRLPPPTRASRPPPTTGAQATATASVPLFTDALSNNTNGWMDDGTNAYFSAGQYHLHNPDPTTTLNSYYQQQVFDNFKVQITVTADTDANPNADVPYAYGLILRADPNTPRINTSSSSAQPERMTSPGTMAMDFSTMGGATSPQHPGPVQAPFTPAKALPTP